MARDKKENTEKAKKCASTSRVDHSSPLERSPARHSHGNTEEDEPPPKRRRLHLQDVQDHGSYSFESTLGAHSGGSLLLNDVPSSPVSIALTELELPPDDMDLLDLPSRISSPSLSLLSHLNTLGSASDDDSGSDSASEPDIDVHLDPLYASNDELFA